MVDEIEFEIMDADHEDRLNDKSVKVVVRWFPQNERWHIAHAKSYQSAFRSDVNSFKTRGEAVKFAEENGCGVVKHSHDQLQHYI